MAETYESLKAKYGNVTLVVKLIGNKHYQYGVVWDPKSKRQMWKYLGKVNGESREEGVPIVLSESDIAAVRKGLTWCRNRHRDGQSAAALEPLEIIAKKVAKSAGRKKGV